MSKLTVIKEAVQETLTERAKLHLHIKKGAFHKWLGKSEDEPITAADIAKGKAAGGHAAKMATFAQNFGHVHEHMTQYAGIRKATDKLTKEGEMTASAIENLKQNSGEKFNIKEEHLVSPQGHHYEVKPAHMEHYMNKHSGGQSTLSTGQKAEQFNVYHNGEHIGHVHSYSAYKDTKKPGSRIVTSRKDVRNWGLQLNHGHHSETYNWGGSVKEGPHTDMKFHTKQHALDQLMRSHAYHLSQHKPEIKESVVQEILKNASASEYIDDFVHSSNPKFEGKSKKKRIQMALGAYYGQK